MGAPYTGRCICGAVTIQIDAEPLMTRQCWCRQCQQANGGGPAHNAMFPAEAIAISGERTASSYLAASGNTITREFCPSCGTPVLGRADARPHLRTIRFGMLDEGHGLKPQLAIWTEEAPDWAAFDPEIESCPRQMPVKPG